MQLAQNEICIPPDPHTFGIISSKISLSVRFYSAFSLSIANEQGVNIWKVLKTTDPLARTELCIL